MKTLSNRIDVTRERVYGKILLVLPSLKLTCILLLIFCNIAKFAKRTYGMNSRLKLTTCLATLPLLFGAFAASAQVTLVTNRSDIASTDTLDWAGLGPENSSYSGGATALTQAGASVDVSIGGTLTILRQSSGLIGNFALGDYVAYTNGSGPITLEFAAPVTAVGAQFMWNSTGNFDADLEAFDPSGTSLGLVTEGGVANGASDDTAIFIGVQSGSANIKKVVFATPTTSFFGAQNDFSINRVSINAPTASAVPEPGGIALLGGIASAGCAFYAGRRRKRNL